MQPITLFVTCRQLRLNSFELYVFTNIGLVLAYIVAGIIHLTGELLDCIDFSMSYQNEEHLHTSCELLKHLRVT